jgi:hypothetical protein
MSETPSNTPATPRLPLKNVLSAISNTARWHILAILSRGEPMGSSDLAPLIGCTPSGASNHLCVLRDAGIVVQGYGRLYRIQPQFLPTPGQPIMELGHCLLRLDQPDKP